MNRRTLLLVIMAVVALTAAGLAPTRVPELVFRSLTDGVLLLLWLLAACGIGRWTSRALGLRPPARDTTLEAHRDAEADVLLRLVTDAALGLGALSLLLLLLGCIGLLSRVTAGAILLIGLLSEIGCIRSNRTTISTWLRGPAGGAWLMLLAAPVFAVLSVAALVLPGLLWGDEPNGYDVVAYHLQLPREWYELGRIVSLRHNVFSFFPFNVEMHALLAMHLRGGAYAGMYLAQLMHGTFMLLTVAAVYGTARVHGRLPAAAAAVVCAWVPWTPMLGGVAYNEGGLMLYSTLAAAWALRGRWALAGTCAGLAAGCKFTGVATAIVLVPLAVALGGWGSLWTSVRSRGDANDAEETNERRAASARSSGAARPGSRDGATEPGESRAVSARSSGAARPGSQQSDSDEGEVAVIPTAGAAVRAFTMFALCAALVLSPWLIRNAIWCGNPVFPLASNTLGRAHFDAGQVERFAVAHAPRTDQASAAARLAALNTQVIAEPRYASIPLGSGGASIPVLLAVSAIGATITWRRRDTWIWLAIVVGNIVVWLVATHLQGRFLVQVVPVLAILAAGVGGARSRLWPVVAAVLVLIVGAISLRGPLAKLISLQPTIGVEDLRGLHDESIERWLFETDRPIVLVGDAKALFYPIPMSRLRYRGVFDVASATSFREAWLGPDVPADAIVIVDAGELERFGRTYRNLPPMPAAWRGRSAPFAVEASGVP